MKIDRRGKIRLQDGDYRAGNFIFREEGRHVNVTTASGLASWSASLDTAAGTFLKLALDQRRDDWLMAYATSILAQLLVVPDPQFLLKHSELINAHVMAHPEYYGKTEPTDDKQEDDKILREEKELMEETGQATD